MKSLLISALAVGAAMAAESAYYIGNYTASGQTSLIPYPLRICVPTGALSASMTYSVFNCSLNSDIEQKKYASTDTTCSGSYTTHTIPRKTPRGLEGYANCEGPSSYMKIGQYLSSCQDWERGRNPTALTTVASDACTLSGQVNGMGVYSRTVCTGEGQQTYLYVADSTCSSTPFKSTVDSNQCHFFMNQTQPKISIYSAILKCVIDGNLQRCMSPLTSYEAVITFEGVDDNIDYTAVYQDLFEYSSVEATPIVNNVSDDIYLNLDFCTVYEDKKYASAVADLGTTTLGSAWISDSATVCWKCLEFECYDETLCGADDYCNADIKCAFTATTTASSANAAYASFTLMMGLLLSWLF